MCTFWAGSPSPPPPPQNPRCPHPDKKGTNLLLFQIGIHLHTHQDLNLKCCSVTRGYKDGLQPESLADGNWLVKQNQPVLKIETKSDTNLRSLYES